MSESTTLLFESASDDDLYAAYFQDTYYTDKRNQIVKEGKKVTFNGYAFFFGLLWFLSKKMYLEALIIVAITVAIGMVEEQVASVVDPNTSSAISIATTFATSTVIGFLGNNLYLRKADRMVAEAKTKYFDSAQQLAYLHKKGGNSYWYLLIVTIILVGAIMYFSSVG